ncbi:hypothetical protein DV495_001954 [Geotrichum candidum]|nr:hypothetical protein DV495_001954 [Geotrichum candidum]
MTTQFDNIYLNQSRLPGRVRMAPSGLGWKAHEVKNRGGSSAAKASEPFLLSGDEVQATFWSRGARGYEVRILTKNQGVLQLDGFDQEEFNQLKTGLRNNFNVTLETREHSLRGWNWGKADFGRGEMTFNVAGKPAFELAYSDVSNSNLMGKTEVAVEFNLQQPRERVKAGDELVEVRFYVPGTVTKNEGEDDNEDENGAEDAEQTSAAQVFYESLKEKADIGDVAGEAIVSLSDILFLTPRGRYDIDMYPTSFRLRGKTYDYKIQYQNIQQLFLLPKPDEIHNILVIQLDPPLRQGQTRYPFLVIQFLKDDELEVELNVADSEFEEKYAGKLKKKYDEATHEVVGNLFRGLSGRKMIVPGSFTSVHAQAGVSCSLKASEGYIFPLETCFMFVPKPTVYIPLSEIKYVTFSRLGGGSGGSSRTFDLTITLLNNGGEHQFSNIDREEQVALEGYIKTKGIRIEDDKAEQQQQLLNAALVADSDSDGDVDMIPRRSDDDEDESVDEDFQADSESDVPEEYDSNHESSGSEDEDASDEEEDLRSKKKSKK